MARKELTENEILIRNLVKAKTAEIRLRHSLAADREVIKTLPTLEADFWRAVQLGVQKEFATGEINSSFFGHQPTVTFGGGVLDFGVPVQESDEEDPDADV